MLWTLAFFTIIFFLLILCMLLSLLMTKKHRLKEPQSPAGFDLPFEDVEFVSQDGVPLRGWWIPSQGSTRTIIFLHGFAGSMDPDLKYAPAFHQAGYNILMFDFRAHGRSGGNFSSLGALEVQDASAAIVFAQRKGSLKVGLLGFSMGGRTALMTAAQTRSVDAVISDGGPLRLLTAVQHDMQRRKVPAFLAHAVLLGASIRLKINFFTHDPLQVASQLTSLPVLLIHGGEDRYTRLSELNTMVSISGGNTSLWSVSGAKHRQVDQQCPEEYIQKVIGFFDRYIK